MTTTAAPLLAVSHLGVRFGGVLAVDDVSFEVRRGEVFTLIGPNGAGKTTVFNLISRLYTPTSGSIEFDGQHAAEAHAEVRDREQRRRRRRHLSRSDLRKLFWRLNMPRR